VCLPKHTQTVLDSGVHGFDPSFFTCLRRLHVSDHIHTNTHTHSLLLAFHLRQSHIRTPYMTVYLVIALLKTIYALYILGYWPTLGILY